MMKRISVGFFLGSDDTAAIRRAPLGVMIVPLMTFLGFCSPFQYFFHIFAKKYVLAFPLWKKELAVCKSSASCRNRDVLNYTYIQWIIFS